MLEQWWFAIQVVVCGAGVNLPPNLNSVLASKSSSANMSFLMILAVMEGMNDAISNACT